jgi:hypothetical protein
VWEVIVGGGEDRGKENERWKVVLSRLCCCVWVEEEVKEREREREREREA